MSATVIYKFTRNQELESASDRQTIQESEMSNAKIDNVILLRRPDKKPKDLFDEEINAVGEKRRKTPVECVELLMTEKSDYFCSPTKRMILREKYKEYLLRFKERNFEFVKTYYQPDKNNFHFAACEIPFDLNEKPSAKHYLNF